MRGRNNGQEELCEILVPQLRERGNYSLQFVQGSFKQVRVQDLFVHRSLVVEMAQVLVTFKVFPTEVSINLDNLEKLIKKEVSPDRVEKEPVAFGLVVLKVSKIIPDKGGLIDSLENQIRSIKGVGEVEVIEVTRTI